MGRSLKSDFFEGAKSGNLDAMLDAIALGVDVDSRDETRSTALMWAASNGWPECVEALIARGAATDLGDYQGVQALSMAAARGKISCVELLLDAGCVVDEAGPGGQTALMRAVASGSKAVVGALLKAGADPLASTHGERGSTAIEVALESSDAEALRALLANAGGRVIPRKALEWASWAVDIGAADCLAAVLENRAPLGSIKADDFSGLVLSAATLGSDEAEEEQRAKCFEVLKGNGMGRCLATREGGRILRVVALGKRFGRIAELVAMGCDPEERDRSGCTALMTAAGVGNLSAISALVRAGAEIDALDPSGSSALMHAAANGNEAVVWALAELGADLELRDNRGCSAMDLARRAGSPECAAYIEMRLLEEAASGLAASARAASMRL